MNRRRISIASPGEARRVAWTVKLAGLGVLLGGALVYALFAHPLVELALHGEQTDAVVEAVRISHFTRRVEEPSQGRTRSRNVDETSVFPRLTFALPSGRKVSAEGLGDERHRDQAGTSVRVLYLPDEPTRAELQSPRRFWTRLVVSVAIPLGFVGAGFGLLAKG